MNIGLLNLRIQIQKNAVISDAIGNRKNTWTDYFSCYATIGGESGTEVYRAGETLESADLTFTVRYSSETAAVTPSGYRIVYGGELYNIIAVDHQNNKRKSLKFRCSKVRR